MLPKIITVVAAVAAMLASLGLPTQAAVADRDCGDFPNQSAAQNFFLSAGGPGADPHRLDGDGDGLACTALPCPCSQDRTPNPAPGHGGGDPETVPDPQVRQRARVTRVVDGDTVEVRLAGGARKDVRILGIDTPEVYGGEQCGGPEASDFTERLLPAGTRVRLLSDPSQDLVDRYGRILRYVHKGRVDVGRRLVFMGHAKVYVYDNNPFRRTGPYRAAQDQARHTGRGLWGNC